MEVGPAALWLRAVARCCVHVGRGILDGFICGRLWEYDFFGFAGKVCDFWAFQSCGSS